MRVKEIDRTANVAWSPETQYPIYMVAGTAAQQLDATFSTSAALEVYSLNLAEATLEMPLVSSIPSQCRFHQVVWGAYGSDTDQKGMAAGTIVGGGENGSVLVYSAEKMIAGGDDCLLLELTKHTGAVKALDFNPFQSNLLASGASESEIYIWDLNKPENPMTPGQKSQPPEEVSCIAWNRQVQHILASNFAARCVVWDLRKNEPIIKVSDSMSRIKVNKVAWHPEVATQMCLSSADDHTPVIQLWDLRYATSPLKVLENHQRGVLSVAWCQRDPDLLMSCGKDNRILCWNPNSNVQGGEVVYELPTNNQWSFDVQWCPRNPGLISSSTFDGHIGVYSLMGGGHPIQPSNKVAESFNTDPFSNAPVPQMTQVEEKVMLLQKPPKWIRKPVGASFAFGGKLVTFESPASNNPQQPKAPRIVNISQVVTETELVSRSDQLQQALNAEQFGEFCALKAANCADAMQENMWNFLRVNFENEPRSRFLQLLGYDQNELAKKVAEVTGTDIAQPLSPGVDAKELAQKMSQLNAGDSSFNALPTSGQASPSMGSKTPISRDEASEGSAAFDEIGGTQSKESGTETPLVIPTEIADNSGLMAQALLMGNFEAAVEMCLSENKMAEAILLAIAGGPELLLRTQKKYFQRNKSNLGRLISSVVTHDWTHIVETCELDNWKEALAVILTYSLPEEFAELCDTLAARLETERKGELSLYASLCYICSGNLSKLVENWASNTANNNTPLALQDLVEKVMVLRRAVQLSRGQASSSEGGDALSQRLSQYASMLAAQGSLSTASNYLLNSNTDTRLAVLQDRLYWALGRPSGTAAPTFPFQFVEILAEGAQPRRQPQQQTQGGYQQKKGAAAGKAGTFNSQAGSFQTNTSSYYGQTDQYNPPVNGSASNTSFAPQPNTSASTGLSQKGPLSHKYPTPSYHTPAGYGASNPPQPAFTQPDYGQASSSMYSPNSYQAPAEPHGSQPYYNPAANTGQYNNTAVSSSPGGPYAGAPSSTPQGPPQSHFSSYQDRKAENAWNDPPAVHESKKAKPAPPSFDQQPPITAPIYGVPHAGQPEQTHPGAPVNYGNYGNIYNPQEHQPAPHQPPSIPSYNPPPAGTLTPDPYQPPQPPKSAPEPPPPVVKGPLPQEHKVLEDIFTNLLNNCSQRAANAQMKRKLEDVARKLEILYDKLRAGGLSLSVLEGLHQLVQAIQQYNYPAGLEVHKGLVSHGNFSEISAFMPALKVLMQIASQQQIYVQ